MFVEAAGIGSAGGPIGTAIGVAIDLGEILAGIFGGGLFGGPPPSIAPSLATPSSPILQPSPDFDSQGWNEQPGSDSGSIDTGTLFGSGNTSPYVFSWQQGQAGGLAPGDVPITGMYFPALVQGVHRATGPVNAAFVATGVVMAIPAAIEAGGAVAAHVGASYSSLPTMRIAVALTGRYGIHFAYEANGEWLQAEGKLGNMIITGGENVALFVRFYGPKIFSVPIRYPGAVSGTVGSATHNCFFGVCSAVLKGWGF